MQSKQAISVKDIFTIGIGPSSSHTVGPIKIAYSFLCSLKEKNLLTQVNSIKVDLFGSLSLTGKGHYTDKAVIIGLTGYQPHTINPDSINELVNKTINSKQILLDNNRAIKFVEDEDLIFNLTFLEQHPNAMTLTAFSEPNHKGNILLETTAFSIGGGAIAFKEDESHTNDDDSQEISVPFYFETMEQLEELCTLNNLSLPDLMLKNEAAFRSEEATMEILQSIDKSMMECIDRGLQQKGTLPGGLNVKRRAKSLYLALKQNKDAFLNELDWINAFALAVNEENAAGAKVVTSPTNGAAGVIPAVLRYYQDFIFPKEQALNPSITLATKSAQFLLTCAAIAILFKKQASISAAEMGCQGEIGVACSMAAAGLTCVLGGSVKHISNAAEIGMEHNLGMTCDPIKGLVQIPCIERNCMGALQAINAAKLALGNKSGEQIVKLDEVIKTMKQIGDDMQSRYKETSLGGLALNVAEC